MVSPSTADDTRDESASQAASDPRQKLSRIDTGELSDDDIRDSKPAGRLNEKKQGTNAEGTDWASHRTANHWDRVGLESPDSSEQPGTLVVSAQSLHQAETPEKAMTFASNLVGRKESRTGNAIDEVEDSLGRFEQPRDADRIFPENDIRGIFQKVLGTNSKLMEGMSLKFLIPATLFPKYLRSQPVGSLPLTCSGTCSSCTYVIALPQECLVKQHQHVCNQIHPLLMPLQIRSILRRKYHNLPRR